MPLSLARIAFLAQDEELRLRVGAAFGYIAREYLSRTDDFEGKQQAVLLAQRVVLTDTVNVYGMFVLNILTDPFFVENGTDSSVQSDVTDDKILEVLRTIWLSIAGIIL